MRNEEVREEFDVDDHYVGPASSCPPPFFRIAVDCYEGYMLILRLGDETYAKLVWVATCKSFVQTKFCNFQPSFSAN